MNAVRTLLSGVGQTLITVGLVLLLFAGYELYGTSLYTDREQRDLGTGLSHAWASGRDPLAARPGTRAFPLPPGEGIAILRIPRFGSGWARVVVEGVARADLRRGPGHYPGTALPGGLGNVVISGHRTTYGAPFNRLDELRPGDPLVLETAGSWFTYRTLQETVVSPHDVGVIAPVPDEPGAAPERHLLTLTTCNPKYSASTRLILLAELTGTRPRSAGPPPGMAGA